MNVRESVKRFYGERISRDQDCCKATVTASDPSTEPLLEVPSYGCGDPTRFAGLNEGETVVDLGSGAGLDCFRSATAVGSGGRVIGVDMTPEMLERARRGGAALGLGNVSFVEGFIEELPLDDASADVVISNCVINLSDDKPAVFAEIARVLKPGGRLAVSDILRRGDVPTEPSEMGWCACIDGAETMETYQGRLELAGFTEVTFGPAEPPCCGGDTYSATITARKPV
ncbi:MAG: methyltransferase domain-containing protein [Trueperaceae bacterium]|nr:MAG: methyltransferase domain-containing protein [Trueperaceae bacterium]